jgi:hypothetical protein
MSEVLPTVPDVANTGAEVERLLAELTGDARTREQVEELVGLLVRLYGEGLARIVELLGTLDDRTGGDPHDIAELLTSDELVSSLLILHGLHPLPVDERVRGAIAALGPAGDGVRLVGVAADGVATLELTPTGCGSSVANRRRELEHALTVAVPDLTGVEIRELPRPKRGPQLIAVDALFPDRPAAVSR